MTIKQCDCCGKVIRDYEGKYYEVCVTDLPIDTKVLVSFDGIKKRYFSKNAFILPKSEHFDFCTECKNKFLSMREVHTNDDD